MQSNFLAGVGAGVDKHESINQCKHCGQMFNVNQSTGWKSSKENFTCDHCYRDGKRDWASYYYDENVYEEKYR